MYKWKNIYCTKSLKDTLFKQHKISYMRSLRLVTCVAKCGYYNDKIFKE